MPDLKFFQEIGRDFLASRYRALLADQMRLGKTVQVIAACDQVKARRILIVCPAIARTVWATHFKDWSDQRRLMTTSPHSDMLHAANDIVAIISYDQARACPQNLLKRRWDVLVCDESHFMKSIDAQRTQVVLAKGGLAWNADRIWCLSGTPAPNHAGELWPLLRAFGFVKMGFWDFLNHFCSVTPDGKVTGTKRSRIPELRVILEKFMLRRTKDKVAPELPKCSLEPWPVASSAEFLDLIRPIEYPRMVEKAREQERQLREALAKLPADEHADYLAAHADNYVTLRRINAILKTPAVFDTIRFEIENGLVDKLVVFAYHKEPIRLLTDLLPSKGIKVESIWGGTSPAKRDRAIQKFHRPNNKGGAQVIVCQILAAGMAIDLSVAHEGIALEEDWVPGNNAQAFERMGGYKQTHPIMIRKAVLPESIDVDIQATLTRKEAELSELFN